MLLPVDLLMNEHRLIERMIKLMRKESERANTAREVDPKFVTTSVEFLQNYADLCHHGKEEGILFKALSQRRLSDADNKMMRELIAEHAYARKTVRNLEKTVGVYIGGEKNAPEGALSLMNALVEFYPFHISKEDKQFFCPCMEYFTETEKEEMTKEFREFDMNLVHWRYQRVVGALESAH